MKIYNVEEHLSCYCYDKNIKSSIEVLKTNQTETEEISISFNEIVFVLKGKIRFTMLYNNFTVDISSGHMTFLPAHSQIRYKTFAGNVLVIIRLKDEIQLCPTFNINRLNSNIKKIKQPEVLESLEINARIRHFLKGLVDNLEDGLKCHYFFQSRITELLIMLRAYYSEEQLYRFFYYYFTPDAVFAEFVRASHLKYPTVSEFANALNMTTQQFTRRFNSIFGEAPYGWMQREKAQLIYGEICRTNRSLKDIADEYGFNIQSNFNRFCKMSFGMNPREIRKQRK